MVLRALLPGKLDGQERSVRPRDSGAKAVNGLSGGRRERSEF